MISINQLKRIATQIRRDILRMVHGAASGHPGGSLGCADFLTVLYFSVMQPNANNFRMDGKDEDIFFLSNGHISPLFYSVLARYGYFPIEELSTFRKIGSRLQGHPAVTDHLPGVRVASGSLGQGLSVAIGAALAKKQNNDNKLIYCLCGDGELQEGQIWEAAMFAAHHKVDNLILTVDYNRKQIDGATDDVISLGNLEAKWHAFGWEVISCNGNAIDELLYTLSHAKKLSGNKKPVCLLMKTEMGMGVDFMTGTHKWHGVAPNDEELQYALSQVEETMGDY